MPLLLRLAIVLLPFLFSCQSSSTPRPLRSDPPAAAVETLPLALPFTEVEAESGMTTGRFSPYDTRLFTAAGEASGRRYVELPPGGVLVLAVPVDSDALVLRYSWPDGADDGRLVASVGGRTVGEFPLTSRYAWVYGRGTGWGSSDVWRETTGEARHFWDETNLTTDPLTEGAELVLTNPADSKATLLVDFVDFERRGPALIAPQDSLSFADFAPDPTGRSDVTALLQKALDRAKGKTLFIPEGTYRIETVYVPQVTVVGAGLWRTRFVGPLSQFRFEGKTASLSDFAVFGETNSRNDTSDEENGFAGHPGPGSSITRVWVEHKKCAFWVGQWGGKTPVTGLTLDQCRFRDTMADAVNLCSGTNKSVVRRCLIRNTGDDGLAAWSPRAGGPAGANNVFEENLVQLPWLASGISLYGGGPFVVRGNVVQDTLTTGSGIYLSSNFSSWPFQGPVDVRDNVLIRTGGHESDAGGPTGSIRLLAVEAPMTGGQFALKGNRIVRPVVSAVSFHGPYELGTVLFDGLTVEGLDSDGLILDVRGNAKGEARFHGTVAEQDDASLWRNQAGADFRVSRSD